MGSQTDIFPAELPPGYHYLNKEPVFDPSRHLQLEQPEHMLTLSDFGYNEDEVSRFASAMAMTSPVRLLSDEGVGAMREVVAALLATPPHNQGTGSPPSIFNVACRSRFVRDLSLNEEIAEFFGRQFHTALIPHTMLHQQTQMNLDSSVQDEKDTAWHHDVVAFAYVLMIHDPAELEGGDFEYFHGTREEGIKWLDSMGDLPGETVVKPVYPGAGYACFMQGSAITHRAGPLRRPGFRCTLVSSFCSTDLQVHDPNRIHFVDDYRYDPQYGRYKAMDWARHKAWRSRAKLEQLLTEMAFTDDSVMVVAALKDAIADVNLAIETIENGKVSSQEAYRLVREEDRRMMS